MNKKNLRKGFTTVELVIVIAVIAILATALIPTFSGLINSANETKDMNAARQAYNDYMLKKAQTGGADDTYYIHSGDHYYLVTKGKLDTKAVDTLPDGNTIAVIGTDLACETHSPASPSTENPCGICGATSAS